MGSDAELARTRKHYSEIRQFSSDKGLPFGENLFQVVVLLIPPSRDSLDINIPDLVRVINYDGKNNYFLKKIDFTQSVFVFKLFVQGFAIVGGLTGVWESSGLLSKLQETPHSDLLRYFYSK